MQEVIKKVAHGKINHKIAINLVKSSEKFSITQKFCTVCLFVCFDFNTVYGVD